MNATTQLDYRTSMQAAALAFLERHQGEHLGDDQLLFDRAVRQLLSMGATQSTAENLVGQAYGALRSQGERLHLDVSTSTAHLAMITDPASGMTYPVPVALIVRHLINSPARRRLRAVQ